MIKTIELPLPFTNLHNLLELYKWYKNYRSQNKTFFALKVGRGTGKFLSIKSILDVIPKQCLCSRIKQARSQSKLAAEKLKLSHKNIIVKILRPHLSSIKQTSKIEGHSFLLNVFYGVGGERKNNPSVSDGFWSTTYYVLIGKLPIIIGLTKVI